MSIDNIGGLLDSSIDDLADLEKFEPLPKGSHLGTIGWGMADDEERVVVVMSFEYKEVLELSNPTKDTAPEPGKKVNFRFPIEMRDGTPIITQKGPNAGKPMLFGQGQLKEVLAVLRETFGGSSPSEIMNASDGAEVAMTVAVKADKDDPDMKFNQIKSVQLA